MTLPLTKSGMDGFYIYQPNINEHLLPQWLITWLDIRRDRGFVHDMLMTCKLQGDRPALITGVLLACCRLLTMGSFCALCCIHCYYQSVVSLICRQWWSVWEITILWNEQLFVFICIQEHTSIVYIYTIHKTIMSFVLYDLQLVSFTEAEKLLLLLLVPWLD